MTSTALTSTPFGHVLPFPTSGRAWCQQILNSAPTALSTDVAAIEFMHSCKDYDGRQDFFGGHRCHGKDATDRGAARRGSRRKESCTSSRLVFCTSESKTSVGASGLVSLSRHIGACLLKLVVFSYFHRHMTCNRHLWSRGIAADVCSRFELCSAVMKVCHKFACACCTHNALVI